MERVGPLAEATRLSGGYPAFSPTTIVGGPTPWGTPWEQVEIEAAEPIRAFPVGGIDATISGIYTNAPRRGGLA